MTWPWRVFLWLQPCALLGMAFCLVLLSGVGIVSYAQSPPAPIREGDQIEHRLTVLETRMEEVFNQGHEDHLYVVMTMLGVSSLAGGHGLSGLRRMILKRGGSE